MSPLDGFPGDPWGDSFVEQDLERFIEELQRGLGEDGDSPGYREKQISGFGNTTQSLLVMAEGSALTDQRLDEAALSLLVYRGRIHIETDDAHLHPDEGSNLFLLPDQRYEIQTVDPAVLLMTFMRFSD
ncbi:MAG: hypothetical protein ABEK50_14275 [bacterium]